MGWLILQDMQANETKLRVRYAETDQMGVVYYANYLVWMEVGRVEYCRAAGFNYRDMEEEDGVLLACLVAEGETVPVNTICAYIGEPGEAICARPKCSCSR